MVPAHTVAIAPGVTVGTAFTVRVIAAAALVPQLLLTVTVPVYTPGAVVEDTGIVTGLDGNAVPAITFVKPVGEPVQLSAYVSAGPVEV